MNLSITIVLRYLFPFFFKSAVQSQQKKILSFSSGFAVFAVSLSVAILIIVTSISNGFRTEMIKRILGFNGHISLSNANHKLYNYEDILTQIKQNSNVVDVYPVVKQQVIVSAEEASGAILYGISIRDLQNRPLIKDSVDADTMKAFIENENAIIIGSKLAAFLDLKLGDVVMVICPQDKKINLANMMPKIRYMKFVGTFDVGMSDYNSSFVFVHLKKSQDMFSMQGAVNDLDVFTKDPDMVSDYRFDIQIMLSRMDDRFLINDWKLSNETFLSAINMQKTVMMLVFCLIILISTFSGIACIVNLIQSKQKEIAILRTIGYSRLGIITLFFIAGLVVGMVGVIIGMFVGLFVSFNVDILESVSKKILFLDYLEIGKLPCVVDSFDVFMICMIAFFMTALSAIYTAFKAAKIEPVDILRSE
ncbi:FtsX-like permease family protein [Candidatus Gromoviella agglomerans]|uniref:FtsX-like permease family protein n=1 Tax=Candidatus Gromoviella agglomerans TaxID=2806609 RepID=UPI001E3ED1A0|nr:FtsX-like permease family protein [Candidatus Gromoviella agglomerans]UFX98393.1 Lipoprotein-releasing system transmembrane protein LolE [Candidatus Gromoviella agglomerans]